MSSLQKLCIDLIVEKFELFYRVFALSKDRNLQKNFEFLQRRFSNQLAAALYVNKQLEDKYFEFLINEHLSFLDGKWFRNSCYLNSMENIFCRLPNLEKICFSSCGNEILQHIAKFCPKIAEIDVRHSNVTDKGVEYLCKSENGVMPCCELKNVFAWPSCVSHRGVELLIRYLPSLEKIDFDAPLAIHHIHKENLSCPGRVLSFNLIELNLLKFAGLTFYYSEILRTCLEVCPKLQFFSCDISNKEELVLVGSRRFKKLHLEFSIVDPIINIDNFLKTNGCNLSYLKISNCAMSVSVLALHCPVLEEFYAHRVNFTDDNSCFQPSFPCVTKCKFYDIDQSAQYALCLFISSSPALTSISFKYCTLSHDVQTQILIWCKNPSARKIHFWCLDLELDFLRNILLSCPSLTDMAVIERSIDFSFWKTILHELVRKLPNKPKLLLAHVKFRR